MNPYTRVNWTLISALIMWTPIAVAMLVGDLALPTAGIYFLVLLLVSYVGVGVVAHIASGYADAESQLENAKRQIEELEARKAAEQPRRRSTDEPAGSSDPTQVNERVD